MTFDVEKITEYPDKTETMNIKIVDRLLKDKKLTITFDVSGNDVAAVDWITKKTNALQGKFALIPRNQEIK